MSGHNAEQPFSITITAQMRHGVLWEARALCGSSAELARLLEVHQTVLGRWINFKGCPSKEWWDEKGIQIEGKLSALLNRAVTYDDLFPKELQTGNLLTVSKRIEVTHDVPRERLIEAGAIPALPMSPQEAEWRLELKEAVNKAIQSAQLTPRKRQILEMRFGLNGEEEHTYEEVAEVFGVTRERIRQIEASALRRLRLRASTKYLKPFLGVSCV